MTPQSDQSIRLFISAGEPSGDLHGAELIAALRKKYPGLEAFGQGGPKMAQVGFDAVSRIEALSIMGFGEVVSKFPKILKALNALVSEARKRRPVAAVLIDFPDFNLRIARKMKKMGIPVIYYITPQIWAWRKGRVRLIRKLIDRVLVIFPFEVDFFRKHDIEATYVGHPFTHTVKKCADEKAFFREVGLDPKKRTLAVLPGSRGQEQRRHLPIIASAIRRLRGDLQYVVPLPHEDHIPLIRSFLDPLGIAWAPAVNRTCDALSVSCAAIVTSGTATVETALLEIPMVVIYRVNRLTAHIGRLLIDAPYIAMVNVIAGRGVVRELIQWDLSPEALAEEVQKLIEDEKYRAKIIRGLREMRTLLGTENAAENAAAEIARFF